MSFTNNITTNITFSKGLKLSFLETTLKTRPKFKVSRAFIGPFSSVMEQGQYRREGSAVNLINVNNSVNNCWKRSERAASNKNKVIKNNPMRNKIDKMKKKTKRVYIVPQYSKVSIKLGKNADYNRLTNNIMEL